jgi:hypothetical protein
MIAFPDCKQALTFARKNVCCLPIACCCLGSGRQEEKIIHTSYEINTQVIFSFYIHDEINSNLKTSDGFFTTHKFYN